MALVQALREERAPGWDVFPPPTKAERTDPTLEACRLYPAQRFSSRNRFLRDDQPGNDRPEANRSPRRATCHRERRERRSGSTWGRTVSNGVPTAHLNPMQSNAHGDADFDGTVETLRRGSDCRYPNSLEGGRGTHYRREGSDRHGSCSRGHASPEDPTVDQAGVERGRSKSTHCMNCLP